ncbi:hypothetical protein Tco_1432843 [Tanacetum coccineum]
MTGCPDCSMVSGLWMFKHMTGDRSQLTNFVHKFLGKVKLDSPVCFPGYASKAVDTQPDSRQTDLRDLRYEGIEIVGSSNGLVCINSSHGNEFSVANPWTREERMVQKHLASNESCWDFGYDPVINDYTTT